MGSSIAATSAVAGQAERPGLLLCNCGGFYLGFRSCLTFLFFQSSPQTGTAVRLSAAIAWLLIVIGYTIVDPPFERTLHLSPTLRWVMIYLLLSGLSLLWTTADSVGVATGYWAGLVADVAAVVLLLRYPHAEANTRRMLAGFISGVSLVAVVAWCAPAMDDLRLGSEDFLHPNLIGFHFALGTLAATYLAQRQKLWIWAAVGLGVTMIRTLSKGTIVAFLFAGLYYLVRGLRISRKARIWIGIGSCAILVSFWGLLEAYLDAYSQGNNVETLTGRTYIWSQALELSLEKPWFGHGFDSFRWVFPPFANFLPHHAHNELLQQLFAYGLVGLAVVVGIYFSFFRQVHSTEPTPLRSFAMAVLVLVLVRGLVDTDQFELCFPLWLLTLLSVTLATSERVSQIRVP